VHAAIGSLDDDLRQTIAVKVRDCGQREVGRALPFPQNSAGGAVACNGDEFRAGHVKEFVARA